MELSSHRAVKATNRIDKDNNKYPNEGLIGVNRKHLISEVQSRTQGSRPRTQKKSEAKDSLSEDRHSRGQGQECSRPRPRTKDTSASALQKKRSSQKFFRRSPQKNVFQKIFQAPHKILTIQKIVLFSSRGQANFRGLEAKAKDFKMCPRGRPRCQGRPRGLHLCLICLN